MGQSVARARFILIKAANLDLLVSYFGFLAVLVLCYPGGMSWDSTYQYNQALSGTYDEFHPPLMAFVWHGLLALHRGPFVMIVLHNVMFWVGIALIARRITHSTAWRCVFIVLFAACPAVFTQLGVVWKDVGQSTALTLVCGMLLHANGRPWLARAALVPLFYGIAVRHNGLAALPPLAIWLAAEAGLFAAGASRRRVVVAGGLALIALVTVGAFVTNRALIGENRQYAEQILYVHQLDAISIRVGRMLHPPSFAEREHRTLAALRQRFRDEANLSMSITPTRDAAEVSLLRTAWLSNLVRFPREYLDHRWVAFQSLLGIRHADVESPYHSAASPWQTAPFEVTRPYAAVDAWLNAHRNAPFFRGWIYCLACCVFALLAWRFSLPAFAVASSGVLYAASSFLIAPAADFRYLYWVVNAAFISGALLVPRWIALFAPRTGARA